MNSRPMRGRRAHGFLQDPGTDMSTRHQRPLREPAMPWFDSLSSYGVEWLRGRFAMVYLPRMGEGGVGVIDTGPDHALSLADNARALITRLICLGIKHTIRGRTSDVTELWSWYACSWNRRGQDFQQHRRFGCLVQCEDCSSKSQLRLSYV